jgi:uncharacterized repeat protein (TIGR03803 family)
MLPAGAAAASKYKVLHSFTGSDGANPYAGLIFDTAGNLYGTTLNGGGSHREGTVFKLKRNSDGSWTESVLYSFCHLTNCADGFVPNSRLIFDAAGNLYGTAGGGAYGVGAVFKLTPNSDGSWTESVLYSFAGADGDGPFAGLIFDAAGNLYGTTVGGGAHRRGIAFKLTPNSDGSWTESVLYSFCSLTNCADGSYPHGCLIFDSAGNLDGTTQQGGGAHRRGTVFKLAPNADGSWTESVLHSFQSGNPFDGLTLDAAGNLYGTTSQGGPADGGAVFKLSPQSDGSWGYSVLRFFYGKPALSPYAGVLLDNVGNLYGTTLNCGSGCQGVVFEITP